MYLHGQNSSFLGGDKMNKQNIKENLEEICYVLILSGIVYMLLTILVETQNVIFIGIFWILLMIGINRIIKVIAAKIQKILKNA